MRQCVSFSYDKGRLRQKNRRVTNSILMKRMLCFHGTAGLCHRKTGMPRDENLSHCLVGNLSSREGGKGWTDDPPALFWIAWPPFWCQSWLETISCSNEAGILCHTDFHRRDIQMSWQTDTGRKALKEALRCLYFKHPTLTTFLVSPDPKAEILFPEYKGE